MDAAAKDRGSSVHKARIVVLYGTPAECYLCGKGLTLEEAQQEHTRPRSRGGPTTSENLRWACERCNRLKGSHSLEELLEFARILLRRFPLG